MRVPILFAGLLSGATPSLATSIYQGDNNASSTGVNTPTTCGNGTWMTQPTDHAAPSNGTFQQQIEVRTEFFKPGGPILLFHGEESSEMTCVDTTIMYHFAEQLGGIAATIEHRYFGLSVPFGNDSYTRQNIVHLTLENVIGDAINFVQGIRANVTGAENSPVIVASGSYGGYLVTMLRQNRPDIFFGALAAAGPVRSFASPENPDKFAWWDYVSNSYSDQSAEAASKINASFTALEQRFVGGNVTGLKDELGLCAAPSADLTDYAILTLYLKQVFSFATELNYPVAQPGRSPVDYPLQAFVNATLAQTDEIQVLNVTNWIWYGGLGWPCIDWTNPSSLEHGVPLIQAVPFSYITCTYVPLQSTFTSNNTIFFAADINDTGCDSLWGVTTPTASELEQRYNYTEAALQNSTRIIFSYGQYDPVTAVGVRDLPLTSDRNASKILYVSNMAHREDLFAPASYDGPDVVQPRAIELETFKEWLGWYA